MLLIGSPTKRNRLNAMRATTSITLIDWTRRRRMNAITPHPSARSSAASPRARSVPRSCSSGLHPRRDALFDLHPVPVEHVVRKLNQAHVILHAPGQGLLVERDVAELLLMDLERLADFGLALLGVDLALDLSDQLVDLGVGVAAVVETAAAECLVVRADQVPERIPRIICVRRPAEHIEAPLEVLELGEVLALGLG